jgi:hypothetical protein
VKVSSKVLREERARKNEDWVVGEDPRARIPEFRRVPDSSFLDFAEPAVTMATTTNQRRKGKTLAKGFAKSLSSRPHGETVRRKSFRREVKENEQRDSLGS